jgi:hypothetical protein
VDIFFSRLTVQLLIQYSIAGHVTIELADRELNQINVGRPSVTFLPADTIEKGGVTLIMFLPFPTHKSGTPTHKSAHFTYQGAAYNMILYCRPWSYNSQVPRHRPSCYQTLGDFSTIKKHCTR